MLISICIPVYNGEKFLRRCLDSIASQTFKDFEIVVVDDCSSGTDDKGWNCKKICKVFTKQNKIKVNYLRNSRNMGSIDARRNAVYEAKGEYIFCVDCDDALKPECLAVLAEKLKETKADIIQCGADVVFASDEVCKDEINHQIKHSDFEIENRDGWQKKVNRLIEGEVLYPDLFNTTITGNKIFFGMWGKLINREVFISAFEQIPPCYCVWGEDYVLYFYLAYFAKKYVGIKDKLYLYSVDTGISADIKIDKLEKWTKICTAASAFAIIFGAINSGEIQITSEQHEAVQIQCNLYVLSEFRYFKYFVSDELKKAAWEVFCEYWGKDYLEKTLLDAGEKLEFLSTL